MAKLRSQSLRAPFLMRLASVRSQRRPNLNQCLRTEGGKLRCLHTNCDATLDQKNGYRHIDNPVMHKNCPSGCRGCRLAAGEEVAQRRLHPLRKDEAGMSGPDRRQVFTGLARVVRNVLGADGSVWTAFMRHCGLPVLTSPSPNSVVRFINQLEIPEKCIPSVPSFVKQVRGRPLDITVKDVRSDIQRVVGEAGIEQSGGQLGACKLSFREALAQLIDEKIARQDDAGIETKDLLAKLTFDASRIFQGRSKQAYLTSAGLEDVDRPDVKSPRGVRLIYAQSGTII